ncbi:MAG: nitroreductase family protein [Helicobacteraceae bacterium]|jgi:nitroreductase|nr:nitroreductase family protein [Helicobacteraceae bacterium]
MQEIFARFSARTFKDASVEAAKVERLLRAAMQAPSAGNQQPWEFLVIADKTSREKVAELCPHSKPLINAPLGIMTLLNTQNGKWPECYQQDLSAASQNILLEAVHLGLAGVWLAIMPFEDRMRAVKEYFKLPPHIEPFATMAIGYAADPKTPAPRYDQAKVHYEKY